ncbi:MAG: YfhO family protein [Candidatus Omnitrophica bacterium]|nr:YfhO family protein [Candidatus Omnitrophota bacterium]
MLLAVFIFPEVFLNPSTSFIWWHDYLVAYHTTFVLTGFLYQGGIQLWDFFGQMPHMYLWITHGMFHLPGMLTALVYWLLSPFTQNSAEFFHNVFSFVYPMTLLAIRSIGMFLLLRRMLNDRWILIGGSVIGSALFCPPAFMFGLFYQSFYPLLMYFILSFFMTYRSRYFVMAAGLLVFCFSQTPIHACYMYLGLQFFIFSCLAWSLLARPGKARQWLGGLWKSPRQTMLACALAGLIFTIILFPYLYMQAVSLNDYEFGFTQSRLSNMWDLDYYFHKLPLDLANYQDMFRRMLDFTFEPGNSFFWGYMIFFLGLVGLVMSNDSRKWIFLSTLLMVWFINFPREQFGIGLLGHWVNALANPFKTIVRSYHMASYSMMPYVLVPLACLGLESLIQLARANRRPCIVRGWALVAFLAAAHVMTSLRFEPGAVRGYLVFSLFLSMCAWTLFVWGKARALQRIAWGLIAALIALDAGLAVWQAKSYLRLCEVRPRVFQVRPEIGAVGIDYQNPKILPFVERFDLYDVMADPVLWSLSTISPSYSRVMNAQLMFLPPEGHSPRHLSFGNWHRQPWMREYINNNKDLFSFASYAVESRPGTLETVIEKHLTGDLVVVEGKAPALLPGVPARMDPKKQAKERWLRFSHGINDEGQKMGLQREMLIWDFPLPGLLPSHLASTIFTQDHNVRFFIQWAGQKAVELEPAQGWLLRPYTFDAQNIKEGKVYAALPLDLRPLTDAQGVLFIRGQSASGVSMIWRHQSDQLGLDYDAPGQGWLRVRFPYDPKWRVTVDGQPSRFYKVDGSFIGVPLAQGRHKILIQYWPYSWLRWSLFFSALTAMAIFFIVMGKALRERIE